MRNWRMILSKSVASAERCLHASAASSVAWEFSVARPEMWLADSEISPDTAVCSVAAVAIN